MVKACSPASTQIYVCRYIRISNRCEKYPLGPATEATGCSGHWGTVLVCHSPWVPFSAGSWHLSQVSEQSISHLSTCCPSLPGPWLIYISFVFPPPHTRTEHWSRCTVLPTYTTSQRLLVLQEELSHSARPYICPQPRLTAFLPHVTLEPGGHCSVLWGIQKEPGTHPLTRITGKESDLNDALNSRRSVSGQKGNETVVCGAFFFFFFRKHLLLEGYALVSWHMCGGGQRTTWGVLPPWDQTQGHWLGR